MNSRRTNLVFAFLIFSLLTTARLAVADDMTGPWKWSFTMQNGDSIESTAKLKQVGEKLSGTVVGRFGESEITEGSVKKDEVSFKVKRERDGNAFVVKYSGKLSGDKITGKMEFDRDGETRSREWEAKRVQADIATGSWKSALILPDGNRVEGLLKAKQDGEKLTGTVVRNDNEVAITEGKIVGDEISFLIIREREGRKITGKYKGKITGDTMKGKMESDWSGPNEWVTLDWEGARAK
jgi:hypothetical protein